MSLKEACILKEIFELTKECKRKDFPNLSSNTYTPNYKIKFLFPSCEYINGITLNKLLKGNCEKIILPNELKKCINKEIELPWEEGITKEELKKIILPYFQKLFIPYKQERNTSSYIVTITELLTQIIEEFNDKIFHFPPKTYWNQILETLIPGLYLDKTMRKSTSVWKNKNIKQISDEYFNKIFKPLAKNLNFDPNRWFEDREFSKEELENMLSLYRKNSASLQIDARFAKLFRSLNLNKTEKQLIQELENAVSKGDKSVIQLFHNSNYLTYITTQIPSESFLLESIKILYSYAYYELIAEFLFDKFPQDECNINKDLLLFKAHILGSNQVRKYYEAIEILNNFPTKTPQEFADLKTSLISNFVRYAIEKEENIKDILKASLNNYEDIFNQTCHYYPGINYAYTLSLYQKLINKNYNDDSIENIYELSKDSIKKDKTTNLAYYATISEYEFLALQDLLKELEIENLKETILKSNPTKDMLIRTLRQIDFYINTLEENDKGDKIPSSISLLKNSLENLLSTL